MLIEFEGWACADVQAFLFIWESCIFEASNRHYFFSSHSNLYILSRKNKEPGRSLSYLEACLQMGVITWRLLTGAGLYFIILKSNRHARPNPVRTLTDRY